MGKEKETNNDVEKQQDEIKTLIKGSTEETVQELSNNKGDN